MKADWRHYIQHRIKRALQKSPPRRWLESRAQQMEGPPAIFIWIPKTAGTSLVSALCRHGCRRYKSLIRARYHWNRRGFVTFGHQSVLSLLEAGVIPRGYFESAYRFAIVRHPESRVISLFHYLRRKQVLEASVPFSRFLEMVAENRPLPRLSRYERSWIESEGDSLAFHNGANPPPGAFNSIALSQCRPQAEWILTASQTRNPANPSNPAKLTHFIGRVESLGPDLREIGNDLGLPPINIPHLNHQPYSHPPLAREDRQRIETYYRTDYETFEY